MCQAMQKYFPSLSITSTVGGPNLRRALITFEIERGFGVHLPKSFYAVFEKSGTGRPVKNLVTVRINIKSLLHIIASTLSIHHYGFYVFLNYTFNALSFCTIEILLLSIVTYNSVLLQTILTFFLIMISSSLCNYKEGKSNNIIGFPIFHYCVLTTMLLVLPSISII